MRILVDTREQCPFPFQGKHFEGVETEAASLQTGDYSLAGLSDRVAVERKSLQDLVMCLGRERDRFERELQRAAALDAFCVIVEADLRQLAHGEYQSRLNPHAACQSIASFTARLGIPFIFAGTRSGAEYMTYSVLKQYLEGATKRLKAIVKAHGEPVA